MERRDFCGIIASPLLRKFVPPSPECGGIVGPHDGPAMTHSHEGIMAPAEVRRIMDLAGPLGRAAGEHWRRQIATLMDAGEITSDITFAPMEPR